MRNTAALLASWLVWSTLGPCQAFVTQPRSIVSRISTPTSSRTPLLSSYESEPPPRSPPPVDAVVGEASVALRRRSWFSWWAQVILGTVSSVILVFSANIVGQQPLGPAPSFFLSSAGLVVSAASIIWTWGNGRRLSRRLTSKATSRIQAASLLRRAIRIGATLNMIGLLLNLLAAEEIVGALAIKVLTHRNALGTPLGLAAVEGLQPIDILVVQANTNSLLSHFCSLASLLSLTDRVAKLDPPSTDSSERNR